jgi:Methyltransferase domain
VLRRIKEIYASGAQATGAGLTRLGVLHDEPPPLERRVRHWAHSLTKVHDSLAIAKLDVPWWTYDAIEEVSGWFASREGRPVRAFEYGSGASTFWLSRRAGEVHSVEHHRGFGEMMQRELAPYTNVTLEIVEPVLSARPVVPSAKEGQGGLDFEAYVASVRALPGQFDLVVVDGRAREACLAAVVDRLAPDGIVVFDNSRRRRYREAIRASGLRETRCRGLTPTLPYPDQTSILRRG